MEYLIETLTHSHLFHAYVFCHIMVGIAIWFLDAKTAGLLKMDRIEEVAISFIVLVIFWPLFLLLILVVLGLAKLDMKGGE